MERSVYEIWFQHTAARRRLAMSQGDFANDVKFQHTAARRRLANLPNGYPHYRRFQHTAARRRLDRPAQACVSPARVSTHSRPKAAGTWYLQQVYTPLLFQHTAARRRLASVCLAVTNCRKFQHTAARRRLGTSIDGKPITAGVSTHSRPKAAGHRY